MLKLLDPYRWAIAAVLAAMLVGGVAWWRYSLIKQGQAEAIAEVQAKAAEQLQIAAQQTANMQEVKDEAIQNATTRAKANAAAAASARSELGKLRESVASHPSVSGDSCAASVDRAAALGAVFGECSAALVELADKADNHANDAVMLHESWPALDDFNNRLATFTNQLKGNTP